MLPPHGAWVTEAMTSKAHVPESDEVEVVGVLDVVHDADEAVRHVVAPAGHVPQIDGRVVGDAGHPLRRGYPADTAAGLATPVGVEDQVVAGAVDVALQAVVSLVPRNCDKEPLHDGHNHLHKHWSVGIWCTPFLPIALINLLRTKCE